MGRSMKNKFTKIINAISRRNRNDLSLSKVFSTILRYKKTMALGLLALIGLSLGAYLKFNPTERKSDKSALVPVIKTLITAKQSLEQRIDSPSTVSFFEKASVNARVNGRVEKLFTDMGRNVKKGQKLARMETFELKIKLRQTMASLNSSRSQLALANAKYKISVGVLTNNLSQWTECKRIS